MFQLLAKANMTHVPYRGTSQALTDLRAGTLQVQFENLPAVLPLINNKEVRALAIGSAKRSTLLPDLPTLAEAGVPGYESSSWTGLFAPAATPPDVMARLERAASEAIRDPDVAKTLKELGAEPVGSRSADFRAFLARRRPLIEKTVKAANMTAK
jgi:tripartite-type tricarboxylate transporter receptor subunit TctC